MTVAAIAPNWLGDLVMAAPALRALERALRPERLVILASEPLAGLARLVAPECEVVGYRRGKGLAGLVNRLALGSRLRSLGPRMVVLFPNSLSSGLAAVLSRARERVGTAMHGRGFLLTRTVEPLGESEHQADAYLRVAEAAADVKLEALPGDAVLQVPGSARARAAAILEKHGLDPARERFIALAPGAAYGPAKHWGSAGFAEAIELASRLGARCAIVGTAADGPEAAAILHRLFGEGRSPATPLRGGVDASCLSGEISARTSALEAFPPIDLTGRTGIAELAGVLALAAGFVGNDSGAAHLAAAVGAPTVALFLSTDPVRTAPRGERVRVLAAPLECRPCLARTCPLGSYACREAVTAREVLKALAEVTGARLVGV